MFTICNLFNIDIQTYVLLLLNGDCILTLFFLVLFTFNFVYPIIAQYSLYFRQTPSLTPPLIPRLPFLYHIVYARINDFASRPRYLYIYNIHIYESHDRKEGRYFILRVLQEPTALLITFEYLPPL